MSTTTANTAKHPKQNRKTEENKVTKTEARGDISQCCRELRASTHSKQVPNLLCIRLNRSYCGNAKAVWFVEKRDMSSCLAKMARMATINYNSFFKKNTTV